MRTKILPERLLDIVKRSPTLYGWLRSLRWRIGTAMGARNIPGLAGKVHFNDFMLTSSRPPEVEVYRSGAEEFIRLMAGSLNTAGRDWSDVQRCLEIGCGYGRIVRFLVKNIPPDRIYVCDVIEEGAQFCAAEFGVNYLRSNRLARDSGSKKYDLIFLCSVFSHLNHSDAANLWSEIVPILSDKGLVVLTTHGPDSAAQAEMFGPHWRGRKDVIINELSKNRSYYERYPWYKDDYGMAWHTKEMLVELFDQTVPSQMELIDYRNKIDLYVFRKVA